MFKDNVLNVFFFKLATTNYRIFTPKNLQNPRDRAPLIYAVVAFIEMDANQDIKNDQTYKMELKTRPKVSSPVK